MRAIEVSVYTRKVRMVNHTKETCPVVGRIKRRSLELRHDEQAEAGYVGLSYYISDSLAVEPREYYQGLLDIRWR